MTSDGQKGPTTMTPQETVAFFSEAPTGAICVADHGGKLLALPASVVAGDGRALTITTDRDTLNAHAGDALQVCVVADKFLSYAGIRGVIAQGSIDAQDCTSDRDVLHVTLTRTVTFSFANVSA
jgi:hypothetical protein